MIFYYLIFIILLLGIWLNNYNFILPFINEITQRKLFVAGVMSSPEHFLQRQAVRNTWSTLIDPKLGEIKFLIGTQLCGIPEEDRINPYVCSMWTPELSLNKNSSTTFFPLEKTLDVYESSIGFTFIVKHDVSIEALGISSMVLNKDQNFVYKVVLYNSTNEAKFLSASFTSSTSISSSSGFNWKRFPDEKIVRNGFEGELKLITDDPFLKSNCSYRVNNHGAIVFYEILTAEFKYKQTKESCPLVNFAYKINDIDDFKLFIGDYRRRQDLWNIHTKNVINKLTEEENLYKDILFLDVVDVYSSLAEKLLKFLNWAFGEYDYILKTDDDVFIDVQKVQEQFLTHVEWDWWSCFHIGFSPPKSGKWRDRLTAQSKYPVFPSGSGYVLTRHIANRLINKPLFNVGEDVSLGFWLTEEGHLNELRNSTCYWACDKHCNVEPCNVPELSVEKMYKVWNSYQKCGNICECHLNDL